MVGKLTSQRSAASFPEHSQIPTTRRFGPVLTKNHELHLFYRGVSLELLVVGIWLSWLLDVRLSVILGLTEIRIEVGYGIALMKGETVTPLNQPGSGSVLPLSRSSD